MIYQILGEDNLFTTDHFVRDWAPDLKSQFHLIPLQQVPSIDRLPVGTYIFSDLERQSLQQRVVLGGIAEQLTASGLPVRLINHPLKAKRRFDLLDALFRHGINDFRVFRATAVPADLRFPAFFRMEDDHRGSKGGLLNSWSEMEQTLVKLAIEGWSFHELIVIEFCETIDPDGIYAKYSAYRVGDRIVPRAVSFSPDWQTKGRDVSMVWRSEPKWEYLRTNPHADQLMEIFKIAEIEYGRADYGLKDGKIQVWEINTSPHFANSRPEWYFEDRRAHHQFSADMLAEAFQEVNSPKGNELIPIKIGWPEFEGR